MLRLRRAADSRALDPRWIRRKFTFPLPLTRRCRRTDLFRPSSQPWRTAGERSKDLDTEENAYDAGTTPGERTTTC